MGQLRLVQSRLKVIAREAAPKGMGEILLVIHRVQVMAGEAAPKVLVGAAVR